MIGLEVLRIGYVRHTGEDRSFLEIHPAYRDAMLGLSTGVRLQVLYWTHELTHADRRALRVHRGGDPNAPLCGVFSLRSPWRPNPIGVSEVEVAQVRDNGILVLGLDARDGSPLLDVKALCR